MNWNLLKKVSAIFLVALIVAVGANIFIFLAVEYGRKGTEFVGCYAYDAMLVGFKCKGFTGSSVVTAWLNWPLWLVFTPMFALFSLRAFLMAILVWAPLVVFVVSVIKLRRQENA
ncbi:hypothetical protein EDC56_1771 [Sinobacterium caligoides]|uniref:Uncharacterized protein n=1 Tax=Sinobacterium caligoides TaxID=933926 RepID=A0A3N2DNE8_9GAMM|nr:hypothetical protein [Sinobacterium caligoides]ROS01336.1 hypothetical protein EDC56_1771 [Sinobacterium caligoides]